MLVFAMIFTPLVRSRFDHNYFVGTVPPLPQGPFEELRLEHNHLVVSRTEAEAICTAKQPGARSECVVLPQGAPINEL